MATAASANRIQFLLDGRRESDMAFPSSAAARWSVLAIVLPLAATAWGQPSAAEPKVEKLRVYVGTYTQRESKGIYRFDMDLLSGKLTSRALASEVKNPSFV